MVCPARDHAEQSVKTAGVTADQRKNARCVHNGNVEMGAPSRERERVSERPGGWVIPDYSWAQVLNNSNNARTRPDK